jgi:hypothetical protein
MNGFRQVATATIAPMSQKNSRGQAALIIVIVLLVAGTIILMSSLDVFVRDYNQKAKDFNQVLLDETTSSAFAVMETALERRLWEPPPDANCLRSENMEVKGSTPDDVNWKVTAHFNFATKNFEMIATGDYKELTSTFKKKIKVMDVSDYLLLSMNTNPINLARLYSLKAPSALIARDRRIYTRGPLRMGSAIDRTNPMMDFNGTAGAWPGDWGTIIQGDRMQFGGGLYYTEYSVPNPNPNPSNIESLLAPYSVPYGTPDTHFSQWGGGSTVITKDYNKAMTLRSMISSAATGPLTKGSIAAEVYPIALFGGTPPLKAWTATDNGTYFNNVDRYSIFTYNYAEENAYGIRIDATCFSKVDAFTGKKYCSHSEHFPKGFDAWRTNAGLDGYLFTADAVAVPSPTIGWDNLESLEDDAKTCGAVISAPLNPYTDCPIWDANFLGKYANGDNSGCQSVSRINLDTVTLNGLNVAALNDPANSGRLLRRIIYLKGPATITQDKAAGLMLTTLADNSSRQNLSIWIVSEDMVTLQGYQADATSPLDVNPQILRQVVFNGDTTGAAPATAKIPLALTILTSERVHLISPFYKEMTPAHLSAIWPASGGKIRPTRHNFTDWERQEDDGFKYGYRKYVVNGVSLISSANTNSGEPFFLQGLWSAPDSTDNIYPASQCMVSKAGHTLVKNGSYIMRGDVDIPAYSTDVDSPIPKPSSRFYGGLSTFSQEFVPRVFMAQRVATGETNREQTEVTLNGITMWTNFTVEAPAGHRVLNTPLYDVVDAHQARLPFDLSHKNYNWDFPGYYKSTGGFVSCSPNSVAFKVPVNPAQPYDKFAVQPYVNNGRQVFVQSAPSVDYRNIGSIVGVDQLVIETKGDPSAAPP